MMKKYLFKPPHFIARLSFCALFLALIHLKSSGQTIVVRTTVPSNALAMASPEAAALGRYGDIPVGLYTGVPDISIPLYTIKMKNLEVPISLSYHASGVKVDDIASNVGLGWSLNYGGAITCAVYGLSDVEDTNGWFHTGSTFPQTGYLKVNGWDPFTFWEGDSEYDYIHKMVEGKVIDTQPDLFYLNFNGRSLKFYFNQQGEIQTMPYQRVKITGGSGFEVTDENDVVYQFYADELTTTQTLTTGEDNIVAIPNTKTHTYYINKITTPKGEIINYEYEHYYYTFDNQISETRFNGQGGSCSGIAPASRYTTSSSSVNGLRIKKITSSIGTEVLFNYDLARTDLPNTNALTSIQVKSTIDNQIKFTQNFTYAYNADRLNLISTTKAGEAPYRFEYNGILASRLSKAQDHWGYENANGGGVTLLPLDLANGFTTGANREADENAQRGILKKISYPTGGSTVFEFENNTALMSGRVDTSRNVYASASPYSVVSIPFVLKNPAEGSLRAIYKAPEGGSVTDPETGLAGICRIQIKDEGGAVVTTFGGQSSNLNGDQIILPNGSYTIDIDTRINYTDAFLGLTWTEKGKQQLLNKMVGGLRVKSITNNPVTGTGTTKYFEYTRSDNPSQTSGWSRFFPTYTYSEVRDQADFFGYVTECNFLVQNSSSLAPLGTMQGGAVGYTEVSTYDNAKTNGYTYHKFSTNGGLNVSYSFIYPYGPMIANEWLEGLPLEVKTYGWNASSSSYYPLKKTVNQYKMAIGNGPNESFVRGAKAVLTRPGIPVGLNPSFLPRSPEFGIQYYSLFSSWSYPIKTIETVYAPLDTNSKIRTETAFYYDNPAHIQLSRQTTTKSTGEETLVELRYPLDINPSYPYQSSPVVEKRISVKNGAAARLVDAEITTYKNQAGAFPTAYYGLKINNPVAPSAVPVYTGSAIDPAYEKRQDYVYDAGNNLVSLTADGLKNTGFKWDPTNQYLIAEAKNAMNNEFFYEGFEETGVTGNPHTGRKKSNGAYTVNWARPNSRAYKISYFYELSGIWKYKEENYTADSFALSGGTAYDDVRVYPADAQMNSYTFEPLVGMTSQVDAKGMTSYFEYDNLKRLKLVKDQEGNIIKANEYHYKP